VLRDERDGFGISDDGQVVAEATSRQRAPSWASVPE
jgi:hypothetical protein